MNHALAAVISVTVNLVLFGAMAVFGWMHLTGFINVQRQMFLTQGRQPRAVFVWPGAVYHFARTQMRGSPEARRLFIGLYGLIGWALTMTAIGVAGAALLRHR